MPENTDARAQSLGLEKKSQKPNEPVTSENLPKNVSMQLFKLMNQVVDSDVNPTTVKAACACAQEIHRMLKLNLDIRRSGV